MDGIGPASAPAGPRFGGQRRAWPTRCGAARRWIPFASRLASSTPEAQRSVEGSVLRGRKPTQVQLLHLALQRRRLEPEDLRGPVEPVDAPPGGLENAGDVLAGGIGQRGELPFAETALAAPAAGQVDDLGAQLLPGARMSAPSSTLASSRTLPGQSCASSRATTCSPRRRDVASRPGGPDGVRGTLDLHETPARHRDAGDTPGSAERRGGERLHRLPLHLEALAGPHRAAPAALRPPSPADALPSSLDAALVVPGVGPGEAGLEEVVPGESQKARLQLALAAEQHLPDGGLEIVVREPVRDDAEVVERPDVPVEEARLVLPRVEPGEVPARVHQPSRNMCALRRSPAMSTSTSKKSTSAKSPGR